jgi:hypothetical protein
LPLALAGVVAIGALLAIGLIGGDEDSRGGGGHADGRKAKQERQRADQAPSGTVTLELSIREPVQVCLVGGGGQALIDGQVLNAGDEESFERSRFELRFPSGFDPDQFILRIAGKRRQLPKADGPASYEIIAPQRVVPGDPPGDRCP